MNILLFTPDEAASPLLRTDPRAIHLLEVLRRQKLDTFDAGLIDGPRGKGTLTDISTDAIHLHFTWGEPPPPLDPITLLIGLPRPQTARKILREATALGVGAIHFFPSDRGEPSYARSTLWSSGEWRQQLIAGAEQAFCTRLPEVTWTHPLASLLHIPSASLPALSLVSPASPATPAPRIALDNYESPEPLGRCHLIDDILPLAPSGNSAGCHLLDDKSSGRSGAAAITLAIGSERGWSPAERDLLRAEKFVFAHLGHRVLRAETAVVAAVAIVKARLGLM